MYNKLKFTLDNIIYNSTSNGKEDIEVILPMRTPTQTAYKSKYTKEKSVVISAAVQIRIKLFLTLTTDKIPEILIHSESSKATIEYSNAINLQANTVNLLTFTTVDGGAKWLIDFQAYSNSFVPGGTVVTVNSKSGPNIILDASDIHLHGEKGPTIVDQFQTVDNKITTLKTTIASDVTSEVVSILPGMIKTEIKDTEIIAETI